MKRLLIAASIVLAGCGSNPDQGTKALPSTPAAVNDAVIAATIRANATAIDAATISTVHIAVHNGVVTLTGEVRTADERLKIDAAAKGASGVKAVHDRLAINPKAKTTQEVANDAELQTKIEAALASQTGVNVFALHVSVDRGDVTVSGNVRTRALHDTVIDTINGVAGVKHLTDRIRIQG